MQWLWFLLPAALFAHASDPTEVQDQIRYIP